MDDENEVKEEKKIVKQTAVKIIVAGEKQSVVQWIVGGEPKRGTVKNASIKDGMVSDSDLQKAIPYGLDFEDVIQFELPDKQAVELVFHSHSIWTAADVRSHPDWVLAALSSCYSPVLKALMAYIKAKKL